MNVKDLKEVLGHLEEDLEVKVIVSLDESAKARATIPNVLFGSHNGRVYIGIVSEAFSQTVFQNNKETGRFFSVDKDGLKPHPLMHCQQCGELIGHGHEEICKNKKEA